jgi:hypothetical protein
MWDGVLAWRRSPTSGDDGAADDQVPPDSAARSRDRKPGNILCFTSEDPPSYKDGSS